MAATNQDKRNPEPTMVTTNQDTENPGAMAANGDQIERSPEATVTNFDHVLEQIGEIGIYQVLLVFLLFVMMTGVSCHGLIVHFVAVEPAWKCVNHTTCMFNGSQPGNNLYR